ncbi:MAG: hypothetical protein KKE94_19015 [Gammaproteobacteria bacterium]|nr:hypothetical protein [Gammaproteobacteria bacterium]
MCNKFIWLAVVSSALLAAPAAILADQPQAQMAYQMPMANKALLTDIVAVPGSALVAIGERGHILVSHDANTWQQATVPVQANLNSVYFISKQQGWAVGHDASILHTLDGGLSWQLQHFAPETDKPLFDVYFSDAQNGIAVGAYGLFYRTVDGGQNWSKEFHPELLSEDDQDYLAELKDTDPELFEIELGAILPHFNRLYADGNVLYLAGEAGFVAKSTDLGLSWSKLDEFYNGSLFDITRSAQMSLIAVGLRGNAFKSTDQGLTWQQLELTETATFNSAFSDAAGRLYLVGNAGSLLVSYDDGDTFVDKSQANGKAIVNGVVWQDKLVLVTESGVTTIKLTELE